MVVGVIVALTVGVLLGAAVTVVVGRRSVESVVAPAATTEPSPDASDASLLSAAFDRLDLAVVICDDDGTVRFRNAAADAMRGTHVGVIVDEHVDKAIAIGLSGERSDKRIDLHGPPRVSLEMVAEPLGPGVVVIVNDVSDRTRIDAMRTDFVANISHELKTPVGAIAVLAEALEEESAGPVVTRIAGRIVEESHRAVTTIDDLLELSRIESARLTEDHVDLGELVESAVTRGRHADESKTVDVTAFGSTDRVVVRGDARQLLSAIGNLVENAVKYSDDHGVVQVRTRVDDRYVEIMVTDQGVGIPERDLGRIFERFYRVDRARSRETGGTGLGLSIVRHVASNHGGDVLVSSQEGEGSTFVLRLPANLLVEPIPTPSLENTAHE